MTNSEKYLKDEKYIFDIAKGIAEAICYDDMEHLKKITEKEIRHWFTNNIKPTLTEDERVILRNIDIEAFKTIGRRKSGGLYVRFIFQDETYNAGIFNDNVFQFIKERRRI